MVEGGAVRGTKSKPRLGAVRFSVGLIAATLLAVAALRFDGGAARPAVNAVDDSALARERGGDAARLAGATREADDAAGKADDDATREADDATRADDAAREANVATRADDAAREADVATGRAEDAARGARGARPAHWPVSESGFGAYEVSLARREDGLVAGWYDTRDGNAEIYLRLLDAAGRPAGPELRLTDDAEQSYEVDLAALGDGIAATWYGKRSEDELVARLAYWHPEHGVEWQVPLAPHASSSRNPVVRTLGDTLFAAWIETDDDGAEFVAAARWSADGRQIDEPYQLAPASANAWIVNASIDERGIAYVVFDAQVDTEAEELYLAAVDGRRITQRRLTADDGRRSKYPDIGVAEGQAALTWFDERDGQREVYLLVEPIDALLGDDASIDARARRVTYTSGPSIGAYLAWNGGEVGLAWTDSTDGPYQVHFQRFAADGAPREPIRRVTATAADSRIPAIRPHADGFAIAWNEMWDGPSGLAHDPDARSEIEIAIVR